MSTASPLAEIEAAVQSRAKEGRLELDDEHAVDVIAQMLAEEIRRWEEEHRRGARPMALHDPAGLADRALRNLTGFGPLAPLLADDDVWEIMVNAPDAIFVKRHQGPSGYHDEVFHDDDHVVRTITRILDAATGSHRALDPTDGLQDAQLASGARLHIVHRDLARGGHMIVNIRKFTGVPIRRLGELVARDMLSPAAADFLAGVVRARQTIVVAGAPGSGKTTMLNCCAAELDPSLRVVTAEEVFEADIPVANVASLQTRSARPERPAVDLRRLVAGFLRMAPDIAVVGEVRDREALPLLLTLSSGVKGFTTIHAGSAHQALTRLRFICQLAETGTDLPVSALNTLIVEAIDVVVHCVRGSTGPEVRSIVAVEDPTGPVDAARFTLTEVFTRDDRGRLVPTGQVPVRLTQALRDAGQDPAELLGRVP